jgi:hypothetical protein
MPEQRITTSAPGRMIVTLLGFTVAFSLVGEWVAPPAKPGATPQLSPFTILFGGAVAASTLILISHAGPAGETFATGLALVAFLTATLVYGKPVWDAINKTVGGKPTGNTGKTGLSPSTAAGAAEIATNVIA